MMYLGDYAEDAMLDFNWSSNSAAGASITRATNGTVSVYAGNGTTQSTAGVTDTEDFDSLTGIHHCRIDLSADAFYAAGAEYSVVLSAATIDGQTVNAVLAHFSIERAGGALALLKSGTFGLSAIESLVDDIGAAGAGLTAVPWNAAWDAEVQSEVADALGVYDPPTKTELDSAVSPLATAAALAVVDGIVDDILVDTAVIGAAGAGLTAVPWNAAWDAEVQSEATDALNAYDPPTKTEMDTATAAKTVEGSLDEIEALRLILAAVAGKATGGGTTTITFRDTGDSKDRIVATVDSNGNRSAVTLDAS